MNTKKAVQHKRKLTQIDVSCNTPSIQPPTPIKRRKKLNSRNMDEHKESLLKTPKIKVTRNIPITPTKQRKTLNEREKHEHIESLLSVSNTEESESESEECEECEECEQEKQDYKNITIQTKHCVLNCLKTTIGVLHSNANHKNTPVMPNVTNTQDICNLVDKLLQDDNEQNAIISIANYIDNEENTFNEPLNYLFGLLYRTTMAYNDLWAGAYGDKWEQNLRNRLSTNTRPVNEYETQIKHLQNVLIKSYGINAELNKINKQYKQNYGILFKHMKSIQLNYNLTLSKINFKP